MGTLEEIERERRLQKIRGRLRKAPVVKTKFIKPLRVGNGVTLYPLEDDPAEYGNNPAKFPKRARPDYLYAIAIGTANGTYLGYVDAQYGSQWFWWRPGQSSAGGAGDTLEEALDRIIVYTPTGADLADIRRLEAAYRRANQPREGW